VLVKKRHVWLIERGNNYLVDVIHLDASQEETCEASQKWSSSSDGEFLVRHSTLSSSERIEVLICLGSNWLDSRESEVSFAYIVPSN